MELDPEMQDFINLAKDPSSVHPSDFEKYLDPIFEETQNRDEYGNDPLFSKNITVEETQNEDEHENDQLFINNMASKPLLRRSERIKEMMKTKKNLAAIPQPPLKKFKE